MIKTFKNKKAFTMIELIIVVVVLGILAAFSIPRLNRDHRAEAINHVLTMIRYTHSLALHDNKHQISKNLNWQKSYWRFNIYSCSDRGIFFKIGSDINLNGNIEKGESAIDPSNGKFLYATSSCSVDKNSSPNVLLSKKYGISSVDFSQCKNASSGTTIYKYVAFDNYGRYYKESYTSSLGGLKLGKNDCKIKFYFYNTNLKPFTIVIKKESGFVYLEENPNL